MFVEQISIFLENKSGRLAEVTKILGDNQIDISRTEFVPGSHGEFLGCYDSSVDQFYGIRNGFFECFKLAFEFRNERRELRKISAKRYGEYTDSCFCTN